MIPPPSRIRILLLALGVVCILGALAWPEPDETPNPLYLPGYIAPPTAEAPTPAPVAEEQGWANRPSPTLSDSEFVERVAGYGVLVMYGEYGQRNDANFYFVDSRDSLRSLRSLGFIQASTLLDSTARIESHVDSAPSSRFLVESTLAVDSALHVRDDGCTPSIHVPFRRLDAGDAAWSLALKPGAVRAVPASTLSASKGSVADRDIAVSLAKQLPLDKDRVDETAPDDSTSAKVPPSKDPFAGVPFEVKTLRRFAVDGAEFIIADIRRETLRVPKGGDHQELEYEQRMFIAERDPRARSSQFKVVWHHYAAGWPDEMRTEEPLLLLHLGPERLLTLYTSGDYKDGGGGLFLARVGPGHWKLIASWYGGC